jgi:flagellar protein FlaJ
VKRKVPFIPLPYSKVKRISDKMLGLGENISKMFPSLEQDLEHSGFEVSPRRWAAIALLGFLIYFFGIFFLVLFITVLARITISTSIVVSLFAGLGIGIASFLFISMYPKLFAMRKIKSVEKNLPYVLHHLLVQVRSGVPLYNSLVSVARSDYGVLAVEMKKAVNEINTGKSAAEALEILTRENPSFFFRRVMWQMINALKSGADIGNTLKEIVDNLALEQRVAIKKYGSQLNPLALMYMLFAVIFPTLGVTFILVLVSFTGLGLNLEIMLTVILGTLILFQFMFVGLIKSRRPIGVD